MIGDEIDTFSITKPDVNHSSFEKVKLRQAPVTGTHTRELVKSTIFFRLHYFSARLRDLNSEQHQNEQVPAKKDCFWPFTLGD